MILYLDTSSLLKFYLEEEDSPAVRSWIAAADLHATSRVTLPEAAAALARRQRSGGISTEERDRAMTDIYRDWPDLVAIELDEGRAADLALRRGLRGFDAVQLAAALTVRHGAGPEALAFSSFDVELNEAARAEGLTVLEPLD